MLTTDVSSTRACRACYGVLRFIMESGAKGCEVIVSGKLRAPARQGDEIQGRLHDQLGAACARLHRLGRAPRASAPGRARHQGARPCRGYKFGMLQGLQCRGVLRPRWACSRSVLGGS